MMKILKMIWNIIVWLIGIAGGLLWALPGLIIVALAFYMLRFF
jgi:hypothetical protein